MNYKTPFMELYEELSDLNEKWETFDLDWGTTKLWYSTSTSEFRAFLQNAARTGIKGLRLAIGEGVYLAARASDLTHDNIIDVASENYLVASSNMRDFELSTCGFPKVDDFDTDNFEANDLDETDLDFAAEWQAQRAAEYAAIKGQEYSVIDPETGEIKDFVRDGKPHTLIADCGTFEVSLYNFYSKEFLAFKNGDGGRKTNFSLFETSETYAALRPLIKKLYMTNL